MRRTAFAAPAINSAGRSPTEALLDTFLPLEGATGLDAPVLRTDVHAALRENVGGKRR